MEQKNWAIARRAVGYARYDTQEELGLINTLYDVYRLYINFFQPSVKLVWKERRGAKVKKCYDLPKTLYQRLLESPDLNEEAKEALRQTYDSLNPVELKRKIDNFKRKLEHCHATKKER